MGKRTWFGAGLVAGAVAGALLMGGREGTRARAQGAAEPTQAGRYQLMTWSYPGLMNQQTGTATPPSYGAYVLDTSNGHLWRTAERGGLEMVGRGGKAQD
jgi:hypothetical protein